MGVPCRPVSIGVFGLGERGHLQLSTMLGMEDVIVPVVCDNYQNHADKGREIVAAKRGGVMPDGTTDYREVVARDDIEAVLIMTSWTSHIKIAEECLNCGNRMLTLCSMASKAAGLEAWLREHLKDSPLAERRVNTGDIVTTMIKCTNGETILLTHDCTLPRRDSRVSFGTWSVNPKLAD